MRDIELEENENRKSLLAAERKRTFASAKRIVESAKRVEEVLSTVGKTRNPKGGRPSKKKAPAKAIAEALGTSRQSVERAEKQVALGEAYLCLS